MNVFEPNSYHFYEVSSAITQYCMRHGTEELEVDEPCFRHLNKKSQQKFPKLKDPSMYNSRHAINVIRVQNMFRRVLGRIRQRRLKREEEEGNRQTPPVRPPTRNESAS
jgi:hypothetical protein